MLAVGMRFINDYEVHLPGHRSLVIPYVGLMMLRHLKLWFLVPATFGCNVHTLAHVIVLPAVACRDVWIAPAST